MLKNVNVSKLVKKIGIDFKEDTTTNVSVYGTLQKDAFKLMKEAGWN